ncbi:MAG: ABC transporter ATP-binding protein [Paracoccaceae bacterium]|tara:strand:+ start:708 stop:2543 length:1836 start_codon:yes stop_codon:yes gene_type:complete
MFKFFERLVDPFCHYEETDNPPREISNFLKDYTKPFYLLFGITAFFAFLLAIIELLLIYGIGQIVDLMQTGSRHEILEHSVFILSFLILAGVGMPLIASITVLLNNNSLMPNIATLFRWRGHRQVMRQSVGWFEDDFAGRIANRVMQTPRSAGEVIYHIFDAFSYIIAYLVGALFLLINAEIELMVPLLIWMFAYSSLIIFVVKRIQPASQAAADARSNLNGYIVDAYTNIQSVKLFSNEKRELEYAREAIADTRNTIIKELRLYSIMDISLSFLNGFLTAGTIGWAIWLWYSGQTSVGVVTAAATLVLRISAMSGWIMWAVSTFFRELGVIREGLETIGQRVQLVDQQEAHNLKLGDAKIEVQNLYHHYGKNFGGLDNLNIEIPAGQKVGLVGPSGAGKSTLFKLLLRFYDIEKGQILINEQNVSLLKQESLRHNIGTIQQESSLLHRSIKDNISYGKNDATEQEIISAAKKARAHEFIMGLEDTDGNQGYSSKVGERGVKLSGGQRQRIALARVILKDAPILLMDEATSALDSDTEAAIKETLSYLMEGKTVIAIAHRLSTIVNMDRILVMNNGRIVEDGSHNDLLANNGLYAKLWAHQSGGFLQTMIK